MSSKTKSSSESPEGLAIGTPLWSYRDLMGSGKYRYRVIQMHIISVNENWKKKGYGLDTMLIQFEVYNPVTGEILISNKWYEKDIRAEFDRDQFRERLYILMDLYTQGLIKGRGKLIAVACLDSIRYSRTDARNIKKGFSPSLELAVKKWKTEELKQVQSTIRSCKKRIDSINSNALNEDTISSIEASANSRIIIESL